MHFIPDVNEDVQSDTINAYDTMKKSLCGLYEANIGGTCIVHDPD